MTPLTQFLATVCATFGLGDPHAFTVKSLPGCANRLWRLDAAAGSYVVKEFRYTVSDDVWVRTIQQAAEFEFRLWSAKAVPMVQPVRARDGQLIVATTSSRGKPTFARVHEWCAGERPTWPVDEATAATAGAQLATIQQHGAAFAQQEGGTLRWWRWRPLQVLDRLNRAGFVDTETARWGAQVLEQTEQLVAAGERTAGSWPFCHFDHKPDNVLHRGASMYVLDWDEAAPCHPRLEAVESALRWAGIERGHPSDVLFVAFLAGYRDAAGALPALKPADFAKCAAGLLGWFDYQGRRALREFDDDETEACAAAETARATLAALRDMFDRIDGWCALTGV